MNKLGFAIVGVGNIGKKYARIIKSLPNADLIAAVDTDFNKRKNLDALIPFFLSIEDFLEHKIPVDIVCICTPNGFHPEHTIKCLNAGYHVICEKPVALSINDVYAMLEAERKSQKSVFAVMQNRYSPVSIWLKKLMEQKRLGEILYVQVNCFWNRNQEYYQESSWRASANLGGGPLYTQFSHFIDLMIWLCGYPIEVSADTYTLNPSVKTDFDDSGNIKFKLKNGGRGTFNYSNAAWATNIESSLTIIGSKGNVKVGGQYMEKLDFVQVEDSINLPVFEELSAANNYKFYKGSADKHDEFLKRVISCVNEKRGPEINLMDELYVINFIEQALLSCLQSKSY
ncbi:oxidoreductase domain protein [Pseudopedobacter saltans DSM 12145]|uniref:Oxidoreductase domain protein n=1 Tax=Pseudopedobacter saltans (strain ATCC 51119 / DSM 12145 / JCM 21818 / CCUG 39354 / LMG 10337 / NBRC 100064 / NCIMB 13643) TaxID=762903 RepID=F0SBV2_PSESL|nr:Gfo/Idh/MocA family oxidoreductase [Pseudopedobacter saltans]ADY53793.1 oxidoreductase domain protein [Pseudopedobacter saltans DSM 12145]